jgi:H+/Cl- antiporter ClcA
MTGGSFGSIIAQVFHLTAAERKTLLVAGAAGGMAATFNTPMAAVLLAVELLLFEWKPRSLIPVALASAVAALLRPYLLGVGPMFPVAAHGILPAVDLIASVVVGLLAWVVGTGVDGGRLRGRGYLPPPAHPLDVVAGTRRASRRGRRTDTAPGAGGRL